MKKLFALLLALVMVMSLAACGGGRTEAAAPAEKPAEENAAAAPEAPAAETGIEAGATIGVSLLSPVWTLRTSPLSGSGQVASTPLLQSPPMLWLLRPLRSSSPCRLVTACPLPMFW